MAELAGVYAASHGPMIVRNWGKLAPVAKESLTSAFSELGKRMRAARPDVLIVISPDHWVNFFIDNLPAICVGVGEVHEGPPEPWLKAFPHRSLAGHPPLAEHIVRTAIERDFEPSVSYRLALAVLDALRPLGVDHLDLPYTPARVWNAIRRAR